MKNLITPILAFASALLFTFPALADAWTDPDTDIEWTYTVNDGKACIFNNYSAAIPTSTTGAITIPSSLGGYPVTSIGDWAFSDCNYVKSFIVPHGVEEIGDGAFGWCDNLQKVSLPSTLKSIGSEIFAWNKSLDTLTLELGNVDFCINQSALYYHTTNLVYWFGTEKNVEIPSTVKVIWQSAFEMRKLETVQISSSVRTIESYAFSCCSKLEKVEFEDGVVQIGDNAFQGCTSLSEITFPKSVVKLGRRIFGSTDGYECLDMKRIVFKGPPPNGLAEAISPGKFHSISSYIWLEAPIRYNAEYADEWEEVIAECGFTRAIPYGCEQKGLVAFVAPNGESSELSHVYTNDVYGVLPEARRDGYTFAGWYTSLEGTTRISAFSKVDPEITTLFARWVENSTDLYAQWSANAYSVNFHANGGTGEMSAQPFLYDQSQALSNSAFSKLGYTFKGWATSENGEVVYGNGECVSNLTAEAGFAIALFAKWEKVIDVDSDTIEEWVGYTLAPKFKKSGETNSQYRKRFESKFGDDYSAAFFEETGKIGMDGTRLCVWHDYVAGTDPLDSESQFKASVTMVDGKVEVSWTPELSDEESAKRVYKIMGKVKLTDADWVEVPSGSESDYNFFKVTVEMK